jgi:hypothetical protein
MHKGVESQFIQLLRVQGVVPPVLAEKNYDARQNAQFFRIDDPFIGFIVAKCGFHKAGGWFQPWRR